MTGDYGKLLDDVFYEVLEYEKQIKEVKAQCDIRTWKRRREKGEYHS